MSTSHRNFVWSFNLEKLICERVQMVPELLDDEAMHLLDVYKGLAQQPNEEVRQVRGREVFLPYCSMNFQRN